MLLEARRWAKLSVSVFRFRLRGVTWVVGSPLNWQEHISPEANSERNLNSFRAMSEPKNGFAFRIYALKIHDVQLAPNEMFSWRIQQYIYKEVTFVFPSNNLFCVKLCYILHSASAVVGVSLTGLWTSIKRSRQRSSQTVANICGSKDLNYLQDWAYKYKLMNIARV